MNDILEGISDYLTRYHNVKIVQCIMKIVQHYPKMMLTFHRYLRQSRNAGFDAYPVCAVNEPICITRFRTRSRKRCPTAKTMFDCGKSLPYFSFPIACNRLEICKSTLGDR